MWRAKAKAEEETRLINAPDKIDEIASLIGAAGKVFLIGLGEDSVSAQAFAAKLSLLGFVAVLSRGSGVDELGHLESPRRTLLLVFSGARQAADAVSDLSPVPRASRQGDLSDASR